MNSRGRQRAYFGLEVKFIAKMKSTPEKMGVFISFLYICDNISKPQESTICVKRSKDAWTA